MNVRFLRGLASKFATITPDNKTFYFVTEKENDTTGKLYLGSQLLSNEVTATEFSNLANKVAELEGKVDVEKVSTAISDAVKEVTDYITEHEADWSAKTDISDLVSRMNAVEAAAQTAKEVSDAIDAKIQALDANITSAEVETGKGIQVNVTEVDGKITSVAVSGNYDNLYDAKDAAADAEQNAREYTNDEITGLEFDLSEDGKTLKLKNKAGTEVATLDTTDFVVDGMLTSVVADQANNKLTFTWNTVSGIQETVIELSSIADIYTGSSNADEVNVVVSNTNEISATIGANVKTNITKGVEAHGWGNHASAGYLKAADISGKEDKSNLKALAYKDIVEKSDLAADVQTSLAQITTNKETIAQNAQTCQSNFNTISEQLTWGSF